MAAHDPVVRSLSARKAALTKHGQGDAVEATAKARAAFADSFLTKADPTGELDPAEAARRAECLRKAYFTGLALKSVKARRPRGGDAA